MTERVQSVERSFLILRALSAGPAGVSEIAARVGLAKSTTSRLLATLEALDVVEHVNDSSDYQIGRGVADILGGQETSTALAAEVAPYLEQLTAALGEAAGFSVPHGDQVRYVAHSYSDTAVQVRDWTGTTLPLHVVPSGLVILANLSAERIDRYLDRDLEVFTPRTMVMPERIRDRLEGVREVGFVWGLEEFADGINSVAAPVLDVTGVVIGAVHVHGPAFRFPPLSGADGIGSDVRHSAAAFGARRVGRG